MAKKLQIAAAQYHTLGTTAETLQSLETAVCKSHSDLILFPEAFLGGYPRSCTFGAAVGDRSSGGREQFLRYFHSAVDLGDTPEGAGDEWVERKLPMAKGAKYRGDGVREELERIARESGVFVVTGLVERSGGSLYCAVVYACPREGIIGKRRKVMPTGSERLIWAQGSPKTLRAVTTTIKGVRLTLAAAICWENYMPLLRQSLYSQNVNLYLAPTADARSTWAPLMQTVGCESRAFVISANQCVTRDNLPHWIRDPQASTKHSADEPQAVKLDSSLAPRRASIRLQTEEGHEINLPASPSESKKSLGSTYFPGPHINGKTTDGSAVIEEDAEGKPEIFLPRSSTSTKPKESSSAAEYVSRGGSCIVSPSGHVISGPLWERDGEILTVEVDFEDCERGRLDLDVAGSYSRNDSFRLSVTGLELSPPP